MTLKFRIRSIFALAATACLAVSAQTPSQGIESGAGRTPCNPWKIQVFSANLSLSERSCLEFSQLVTPGMLLGSAAMAGYAQWRNSPHMRGNDSYDLAVRFEHIYARKTARITGEWLVGALHHEDPRPRFTGKQGTMNRVGAAFLSVLESPDQDGKARMAFAPLAGSLGSGLTSMALYQRQNSIGYGLERSGIIYSHYFIRAIFHEFGPDLWHMAPRFVKKYHNTTRDDN